jgi:hypothetical protein
MHKVSQGIGPILSRPTRPEVLPDQARASFPRRVHRPTTGSNRLDAPCFRTDRGRTQYFLLLSVPDIDCDLFNRRITRFNGSLQARHGPLPKNKP